MHSAAREPQEEHEEDHAQLFWSIEQKYFYFKYVELFIYCLQWNTLS